MLKEMTAPGFAVAEDAASRNEPTPLSFVLVTSLIVLFSIVIVNLALPSLQHDFHTIDGVEWVITSYLAAVGVSQMASSWVADKTGKVTVMPFAPLPRSARRDVDDEAARLEAWLR